MSGKEAPKHIPFSLVICTRNRAGILSLLLRSLTAQDPIHSAFEVVIVDNGSNDRTPDVIAEFSANLPVTATKESSIGLSIARNTGSKIARYSWLVFLDDDILLPPGYLQTLDKCLKQEQFMCFGGPYHPKFQQPAPSWLPEDFGSRPWPSSDAGPIRSDFLSGGNFVIKKALLFEVGGFPSDFGMSGHRIGYGEENVVQERLRALGYTIGYYPELSVEHWVLKHKYKLGWHLRSYYAHGKAGWAYVAQEDQLMVLCTSLPKSLVATLCKHIPMSMGKWLLVRNYRWQNAVLESSKSILISLGLMRTYRCRKSNRSC